MRASDASNEIPQYVVEHAPLIHLYSKEEFWPCDIAEHLQHTRPYTNYTLIDSPSQRPNLTNLNDWNQFGRYTYLQSDDDVEERPEWLGGKSNIPSSPELGELRYLQSDAAPSHSGASRRRHGGRSDAPAVLIVVEKGDGIVDAFWFFFYSYNLGNKVLNVRFGNHVGDWEHTLVRFKHGKPHAVFFSEHFFGEAYSWDAVEKIGKRVSLMSSARIRIPVASTNTSPLQPVGYSAEGTHAMYAVPGVHRYILPWGLLSDVTDRGPLWDPLLNSHTYTYDTKTDLLRSSNLTSEAPVEWFYYIGKWGDKAYPQKDPRQYKFAGQYHYVNGPSGPRFKNLRRQKVCQGRGDCELQHWRGTQLWPRIWRGSGDDKDFDI
ncbi:MAG: Vacuolar protein sorting-associated protein 62 [Chrysothrix sp. TS-e1954]|nr:MAG: Vacuolar protein sorting-associated protein 62 [Chrysothrix sp. TS-e1954]